jgi:hypothetical protein
MPKDDKIIEPINAAFDDVAKAMTASTPAVDVTKFLAKAKRAREAANELSAQIEMELVRFDGENAHVDLNFDWSHETVWASQKQIADLFGVERSVVTKHIANIFDSEELDPNATCANFALVRLEGARSVSRDVEHYNLDVILSVGYRVSSVKATEFRKWATQTLRRYITDGFALNESRLRSDPSALRDLAAQVRALRSEEKTIYEAVRDCFKVASIDYDKDSPKVRSFYAKLQDKFLYAITGRTASELILERADAAKHNMGLTSTKGALPTKQDTTVGKNYLQRDEVYVLHILCEQFLLYAESRAIRGKSMTMDHLAAKLDDLLRTNDYAVFTGYRDFLKDRAMEHAEAEWNRFQKMLADGTHLPIASNPIE